MSIYWGLQNATKAKGGEKRREETTAEIAEKADTVSAEPTKREILGPEGVLDFGAVVEALDEADRGAEVDVEGQVVMVSISHDGEYAVATALAPLMGPASTDGVAIGGGGDTFRKVSRKPVGKTARATSAQ